MREYPRAIDATPCIACSASYRRDALCFAIRQSGARRRAIFVRALPAPSVARPDFSRSEPFSRRALGAREFHTATDTTSQFVPIAIFFANHEAAGKKESRPAAASGLFFSSFLRAKMHPPVEGAIFN